MRQGAFTKNRYYTYSSSKNAWVPSTEVEKDSYFVQMSATSTFTDIKDVYEGIKPNERVIFVLRHAERGDDTSKGGSLTDNGKAQSKAVGEKLTKFEEPFLLGGSEFKRAHQTVGHTVPSSLNALPGSVTTMRSAQSRMTDSSHLRTKE